VHDSKHSQALVPPFPPEDRDGRRLRAGDVVRIVGVPELSQTPRRDDLGTREVFEHIRGTYRRIASIDENGLVEIELRISKGRHAGLHFVWIEPFLLKKRESKQGLGNRG